MSKTEKLLIIGGVAAGPKAAARARRLNREIEITIVERGLYVSYAGCGLPYHISGEIVDFDELIARTPDEFQDKENIQVLTGHQALRIDKDKKLVSLLSLSDDEEFDLRYDKLIIATGTSPVIPPLPGVDLPGVFTLKSPGDALAIKSYLNQLQPRRAVIVGAGLIGLEMAEAFSRLGLEVMVVEKAPHILAGLDADMAQLVSEYLREKGVNIFTGEGLKEIRGDQEKLEEVLTEKRSLPAELVLLSLGVHPEVKLAREAGVALGVTGAIRVNERMETSVPDIYAAGDCVELKQLLTGKPFWAALGSVSNKTGRVAGENAAGGEARFPGVLGAMVARIFDFTVARVGLSSAEAKAEGYDSSPTIIFDHDKAEYYPGSGAYALKLIAENRTGRILGAQAVGHGAVDKRIDVLSTAILLGGKCSDLGNLDLAYAPPYSPALDGVITLGYVSAGKVEKGLKSIDLPGLKERIRRGDDIQIVDLRTVQEWEGGAVPGAVHIPLNELKKRLKELDPTKDTVVYCQEGTRALRGAALLRQAGFQKVWDLTGGYRMWY